MVKRLDEAYGRLQDALKSLNLAEDTIVLFTSDHGNHFRTRNSEYKRSCHDSSIRVPTVFSGPGFRGGGQVQELVSLIDLPPTLLAAARLEVPEAMQGRSILPLLGGRGQDADWPEAEAHRPVAEEMRDRLIRRMVEAGERPRRSRRPRSSAWGSAGWRSGWPAEGEAG